MNTQVVKVQKTGRMTLPLALRTEAGIERGGLVVASVRRGRILLTPQAGPQRPGDGEYTPGQRRLIDARLDRALAEVSAGLACGPFDTAAEMESSLRRAAKKRGASAKRGR